MSSSAFVDVKKLRFAAAVSISPSYKLRSDISDEL